MTVVHVDRVRLQNFFELVDEGAPRGLNPQNVEDFSEIVGVRTIGVDLWMGKNFTKISSFCLKDNELILFLLLLAQLLLGVAHKHHSLRCLDRLDASDT